MRASSIAAVFFAASAICAAHQQTTGHLTVTVTDTAGAIVPGAAVDVGLLSTGSLTRTRTDDRGQAVVEVTPGNYSLQVSQEGFKIYMMKPLNIDLLKGSEQSISVVLQVGQSECEPCFTVLGADIPTTPIEISYSLPLEPQEQFPLPAVRPSRRSL